MCHETLILNRFAKLADRRLVRLIRHNVPVLFDTRPGWSLVALPLEGKPKELWWVPSTSVAWFFSM